MPKLLSIPPIAIVVSRYNDAVTRRLELGAIDAYQQAGGDYAALGVIEAPGAYEVIALADAAARSGLYRGVCALGCIIKGETQHDEYLANAIAQGLARITLDRQIPVTFGVLTVNSTEQAIARAGGDATITSEGNKGAEAMQALLETLAGIAQIDNATTSGDPAAIEPTIVREIAKLGSSADASHGQGSA